MTWAKGGQVSAAVLRSDVVNAVELLTSPPLFTAAQTGVPATISAVDTAGDTITAPGTSYASAQTIVFATTGALPSPLVAGTVYVALSPSGSQFQVATTAAPGTVINLTTTGSGTNTVAFAQQAATATWAPLNLDTTGTDLWAGHLTTVSPDKLFAMLDGWYLCEFSVAPNYTGGAGTVSAGFVMQQGTSPVATVGGQRAPSSGTASRFPQVTAAKLARFSVTGTQGGLTNNYVSGAMFQDSGATQTALITATRYPQLQVQWVSAITGSPALPVPDNDTWPASPQYPTATFANKNIRDTIGFLSYPPVFEATFNGSATLAAQASLPATGTTVALDTVNADTYSGFDGTSTYVFPRPGVYYLFGAVALVSRTTGTARAAGLMLTSANFNGGSTATIWGPAQTAYTTAGQADAAVVRRRIRVQAGDTVSLAGFQADSGSNAATYNTSTWRSRLIAIWEAK